MAVMAGEICDFSLFFFTKIDRPSCLNGRDPFFFVGKISCEFLVYCLAVRSWALSQLFFFGNILPSNGTLELGRGRV